jgi:hypothetical protein
MYTSFCDTYTWAECSMKSRCVCTYVFIFKILVMKYESKMPKHYSLEEYNGC